jgi:hypothetical protein
MMTRIYFVLFLSLGLTVFAVPQDHASATPSNTEAAPAPPAYCDPCIFYSGDFDPANHANGLLNGLFPGRVDGKVWVPFAVQDKIEVQGMFVNQLFSSPPPSPVQARWAIRAGVLEGNGGKVQCSGTATAKAQPTGRRAIFGNTTYTEWTYKIVLNATDYCKLKNPARSDDFLPPGGKGQCPPDCYMSMQANNNNADAATSTNFGYLSNIPTRPNHHFGSPNELDNSFFSSTAFGDVFVPAAIPCKTGPPVALSTESCHMFSVGLIGTGK